MPFPLELAWGVSLGAAASCPFTQGKAQLQSLRAGQSQSPSPALSSGLHVSPAAETVQMEQRPPLKVPSSLQQ